MQLAVNADSTGAQLGTQLVLPLVAALVEIDVYSVAGALSDT